MRRIRTLTLLKLALISIISVLALFLDDDVNSQTTTTCTSCTEQYYSCMFGYELSSCVEGKVQQCRIEGYDEASCENARSSFEVTCRNELEGACQQSYYSCWSTCTINGNQVPPGSAPPPPNLSTCVHPYWTGFLNSNGEAFFTLENDEEQPAPGAFLFYIDGQSVSGWVYTNSFQIPQAYRDGQQHAFVASYVYGCGYSLWGGDVLNTTFILAPN